MEKAKQIYEKALSRGYDNCGIIKISDVAGYKIRLEERINNFPQSECGTVQDKCCKCFKKFVWKLIIQLLVNPYY